MNECFIIMCSVFTFGLCDYTEEVQSALAPYTAMMRTMCAYSKNKLHLIQGNIKEAPKVSK